MKIAWTKRTTVDWTTTREEDERHYEIPEGMDVKEGDYVIATRAHGELTMMKVIRVGDESELNPEVGYVCPLIGLVNAKAHQDAVNQRIALKEAKEELEEATRKAEEQQKQVNMYLEKLELAKYSTDVVELVTKVAQAGDEAAKLALMTYRKNLEKPE